MTEAQPLVADSFARLADALEPLPDADWSRPSLCSGWEVRHVLAHLTMAARYPAAEFRAELQADGFDFQRTSDRLALTDGGLPPADLVAALRSDTMADFEQPGGGWIGSLTHVVIHGLDATLPLGLGRPFSDEATRSVLDALVEPGERSLFGVELKGMALHATDLEWRHGGTDAPVSEAAAAELVVVLAGRTVPS